MFRESEDERQRRVREEQDLVAQTAHDIERGEHGGPDPMSTGVGAMTGAAVGLVFGGPPGAVIGGVVGAVGGALAGGGGDGDDGDGDGDDGRGSSSGGLAAAPPVSGVIAGPAGAVIGGSLGSEELPVPADGTPRLAPEDLTR